MKINGFLVSRCLFGCIDREHAALYTISSLLPSASRVSAVWRLVILTFDLELKVRAPVKLADQISTFYHFHSSVTRPDGTLK